MFCGIQPKKCDKPSKANYLIVICLNQLHLSYFNTFKLFSTRNLMFEVEDCRSVFESELKGFVIIADLDQRDADVVAVIVQLFHLELV
jgi:hypothetical protein